jgi:sRNA-binding carbon storage regulator CsrA
MLVLSRVPGKSIVLTDRETGRELARVHVLNRRANQIKVGIEAAADVNVARAELPIRAPVNGHGRRK